MPEIKEIPIGKIKVGEHEQRLGILDEDVDGLVVSIGRVGILAPLIVRRQDSGIFLVSGHRRLAAAKKANFKTVPCIERSGDDVQDAEVVFAENFFRKDLSPVELAAAIDDELMKEVLTVERLAAGFHKSTHWVMRMRAICSWPSDVQKAIHEKAISVSAGNNLALVTDDTYRAFLVRNAIEQGATARTTSAWLQAFRAMQPAEEAIRAEPVPGQTIQIPAVPQAPCFCCAQVFPVNEVSHVPICGGCVQVIRQVGSS